MTTNHRERAEFDDILAAVAAVELCHSIRFAGSIRRYLYAPDPVNVADAALDLGCGLGHGSLVLQNKGYVVTAVDKAECHPDIARVVNIIHIQSNLGVFEPLPAHRFNLICMCDVLEHLENPAAMLRRAASWLKPGGLAYIAVPVEGASSPNPYHLHAWDLGGLRAMLDEHWQIIDVLPQSPPGVFWATCRPKGSPHA